jgi:hypothetical protein
MYGGLIGRRAGIVTSTPPGCRNVTWLVPWCLYEIPYFLATVITSSMRQSCGLSRMPARILAAFATRIYGTTRGTTGPRMGLTGWLLTGSRGIAVDPSGNIFVASPQLVQKVSPSGLIITVAGMACCGYGFSGDGGPATSALLDHPAGVALDSVGNLYIGGRRHDRRPENVLTTVEVGHDALHPDA